MSWSKLSHFVFWLRLGRFWSFSGAILASLTSRIPRKPTFYDKIRLFTGFGRIKKYALSGFVHFDIENAVMKKNINQIKIEKFMFSQFFNVTSKMKVSIFRFYFVPIFSITNFFHIKISPLFLNTKFLKISFFKIYNNNMLKLKI